MKKVQQTIWASVYTPPPPEERRGCFNKIPTLGPHFSASDTSPLNKSDKSKESKNEITVVHSFHFPVALTKVTVLADAGFSSKVVQITRKSESLKQTIILKSP